jgi:GNAT superfamily N-acetyltransferase
VSADGTSIGVCRLRFEPSEAWGVLEQVKALQPGARTRWQTTRVDLAEALYDEGCRPPGPPLDPSYTALATDREPPGSSSVEVRRIESYDEHLAGLEIMLASAAWTEEGVARQRAEAAETYERRRRRAGGQWLAFVDGLAVAWATAIAGPRGLFLDGGATLPTARGLGCYRALVRARWDEAVRLGTPALVVGAQDSSRPILERCGFEVVCTMYELESAA